MNKYLFSYSIGGYCLLFLCSLILSQIAREYQALIQGLLLLILLILLIIVISLILLNNKQLTKAFYLGLSTLILGVILGWSH